MCHFCSAGKWPPIQMSPYISVIIVNYNSGYRLEKCLSALSLQTYRNFEVIIVDNNSSDASLEFDPPENLDFTIIRMKENVGFAAANNRASKKSSGEWLALLNPDAYAKANWLEEFTKGVERFPDVDAFGSLQLNANDPTLIDGAGDAYFAAGISYRGQFNRHIDTAPPDGECFAPCAAAAFFKRQVFENLGGFEESFFCYSEDVDLAFRLRLSGGRCIQLRDAIVHHEGSGITKQISGFAVYHGHRNRLWTYFRNMPLPLLILTLPAQLVITLILIPIFVLRGSGSAYMRGVWHALINLPQVLEERSHIQLNRQVSFGRMAKAMTWSPIAFWKRDADLY